MKHQTTMRPIILELPYPVSANRYWRNVRGRTLVSREARAYKTDVGLIAYANQVSPFSCDVELTVHLYRPRKAGDLDNSLKVLVDSLKGIAFHDDKQIVRIVAERYDDKLKPRAMVRIEPARAA